MRKFVLTVVIICAIAFAIAQSSTTLFLSSSSDGDTVELVATVLNQQNEPVSDVSVDFILDEASLGSVQTDSLGSARKSIDMPAADTSVQAVFAGDTGYTGSSDSETIVVPAIKPQKTCMQVLVEEDLMGVCILERVENICSDPPANTSCTSSTTSVEYPCAIGRQTVQKESCEVVGYDLGALYVSTSEYTCTQTDHELLCDSIFDGDGSGTCESGETCVKYIVSGNVQILRKNSEENFVADSQSFFLEIPEVLQ